MSLFQTLQSRRCRVLFVCVGNSCRSQMAEALAKSCGPDVMESSSAGFLPASRIASRTFSVMKEMDIALAEQFPKHLSAVEVRNFDLIVNMSGCSIPGIQVPEIMLPVADPIGKDDHSFRLVRDQVQQHVRLLAEHLRRARGWASL